MMLKKMTWLKAMFSSLDFKWRNDLISFDRSGSLQNSSKHTKEVLLFVFFVRSFHFISLKTFVSEASTKRNVFVLQL